MGCLAGRTRPAGGTRPHSRFPAPPRPHASVEALTGACGLSPEQVEGLLSHELVHIRRYDHLVNLVQRVIEALLFVHPAVWVISRAIRAEREHCCDDLVVSAGGEAAAYADSLVRVAELSRPAVRRRRALAGATLNATGRVSALGRRIARLLGEPSHKRARISRGWAFAGEHLLKRHRRWLMRFCWKEAAQ